MKGLTHEEAEALSRFSDPKRTLIDATDAQVDLMILLARRGLVELRHDRAPFDHYVVTTTLGLLALRLHNALQVAA